MKLEEVMVFLEREAERGTLKSATATAMKAACSKVQGFLDEKENDVTWLADNLDTIFDRVANKDETLNQTSIQTYKSRALKALDLYQNFKKDPQNWHKNLRRRDNKNQNGTKERKETNNDSHQSEPTASIADISIPFRDDFDFKARLPKDATTKELLKLCYHLMILAKDFDPTRTKADWFAGSGGRANQSREIEQ